MLVSIPLHLDSLPGAPKGADLEAGLVKHYGAGGYVRTVAAGMIAKENGKLEPQSLNNTNYMELRVYANEVRRQAVLVARLDNLGKGASGAAVQNLDLMLALS